MKIRTTQIVLYLVFLSASLPVQSQDQAKVAVTQVSRQAIIEQINASGSLVSLRNAEISVKTAGAVQHTTADAGDSVSAGQLLLQLDDKLVQRELALSEAREQQAEILADDAEQQLSELLTLAAQDNVAASEVRRARARYAAAQAEAEAAQAERARIAVIADYHQLVAPFSGIVAQRHVTAGEWLDPGDTVYQLVDLEQVYADFYLPEHAASLINNEVTVQIQSGTADTRFSGELTDIVRVADIPSRTFLVRVQPEPALPEQAIVGAPLTAIFRFELEQQGLVVPRDAILRYPDGRIAVWMVKYDKNDSPYAEQQILQIGRTFDGLVEIISGLSEGDTVVVRGNEALQPKQQLAIVEDKGETDGATN
ncbi:efflux RND transporter periplasmic adaptor subunit [Pseudidiomarina sp.]|uniref:efflux RND transporter periplasmic adaptor subunit n=1 Tax=Pseudidiomarina sp. TaxID=2081707 RepID=UPI00299F30EF|nr:efflux RND transporter periplasmic adaptor subunit [Pseudidiomarina sp.]MDX1704996.1 efflux RND transporter periplasmic adaptor subunit [Pseudidiomarina sp.]